MTITEAKNSLSIYLDNEYVVNNTKTEIIIYYETRKIPKELQDLEESGWKGFKVFARKK